MRKDINISDAGRNCGKVSLMRTKEPSMRYERIGLILIICALSSGCNREAKSLYDSCVKFAAEGDVYYAWKLCADVVQVSPASRYGIAATAKLEELKPEFQAWLTDYNTNVAMKRAADLKIAVGPGGELTNEDIAWVRQNVASCSKTVNTWFSQLLQQYSTSSNNINNGYNFQDLFENANNALLNQGCSQRFYAQFKPGVRGSYAVIKEESVVGRFPEDILYLQVTTCRILK